MNVTTPDNIASADTSDVPSFENITAAVANSVQTALDYRQIRSYKPADATALAAITGMSAGDLAYQQDTGAVYLRGASAWALFPADSGYIAMTLLNSWVNFGGAYSTARYRKVGGWVELTGLIKSGTTTSSTVIVTLPAGFRPATQRMFPAVCSANAFAVLEAKTTGDITVASVPSSTYLSLDGIRFFAEA